MNNINQRGFILAFINSEGNMSTNDFLENGYTMEHFIRFTQSNISYETMKNSLIEGIKKLESEEYKELLELLKNS